MTDYPGAVYAPRTKENIAGTVYDSGKANVGYAEDMNYLENEVLAMIADLVGAGSAGGLKGAAASFKVNWLAEHTAAGAHTTDSIAEKTPGAGVTVDECLIKDGSPQLTYSYQTLATAVSSDANIPTASRITYVAPATGIYKISAKTICRSTGTGAAYITIDLMVAGNHKNQDGFNYNNAASNQATPLVAFWTGAITKDETIDFQVGYSAASGTRVIFGENYSIGATALEVIRIA